MIDEFLKQHGLTRYQASKLSGIRETVLASANTKDIQNITVKTLLALGVATGMKAGDVLNELLKISGNSIMQFMKAHPYLDKDLVQEVENKLIEMHEKGFDLNAVTFNRYYDEVEDTNENAEIAMRNLITSLDNIEKLKSKSDD